jgi:hypothetical protein
MTDGGNKGGTNVIQHGRLAPSVGNLFRQDASIFL